MTFRKLLLLSLVLSVITGCQTWQPNRMPPTASLPQTSENGVVEARYWANFRSGGVSELTDLVAYPDNPSEVIELTELRGPANRADYYGSLVRGFILPPTDGSYQFFVAGDGETQFWLSSNEAPSNAQMVGLVPGSSNPSNYTRYSSQSSGNIELQANKRYYFEIRHVERSGADHFNVAWSGPGFSRRIIDGGSIASYGQSPYPEGGEATQDDVVAAYTQGYRVGFFDHSQNLPADPSYPPMDQDQDGLYDNWETVHGLDPNDPTDAQRDADDDILTALDEYWLGTDPNNPDTDNDGIPDGIEFANELNPLDADDAQRDIDGDGVTNLEEYREGSDMTDASDTPGSAGADIEAVDGFVGQYFVGMDFEQFVMTREDGDLGFSWGRGQPAPDLPQDEFSVRWNGTFTAPHTSGTRQYRFTTTTDDGVRLYLDNELVIDRWVTQGSKPYNATISLSGGESIPVTMEYFDSCCGAVADLSITDLSNNQPVNIMEAVTSPAPSGTATGGRDSDSDGIPDNWEIAYGLNPWVADASDSANNSGISNLEAYQSNLDPWTLESTGDVSPAPPPEEIVTPGSGEVTLTWTAPLTRVDGSSISLSEIQSYEVVYGPNPDQLNQTVKVDGSNTGTTISGLESGTWHFAVRTIDASGVSSELSDTVEYQVE